MSNYGEIASMPGIVAYYKFENNLNDSIGARTLTNNSTTFVRGKIGTYGLNIASTQYVNRADNYGIGGGACTFSFLFKYAGNNQHNGDMFQLQDSVSSVIYQMGYDTTGPLLQWIRNKYGVGGVYIQPAITLTVGSWYHFVLCYDATNLWGWVNGLKQTPQAASGNGSGAPSSYLCLASNNSGSFQNLGIYDEFIIANVAWSDAQVLRLYSLYRGLLGPKFNG